MHRKDSFIQLARDGKYLRYIKEFIRFLYTDIDSKDSKCLYICWEKRDPVLNDYLRKIDSDLENKSNPPYKRVKFEREQARRNKRKNTKIKNEREIKQKPRIKEESGIKQKSNIKKKLEFNIRKRIRKEKNNYFIICVSFLR
jgi:hypothetical protein